MRIPINKLNARLDPRRNEDLYVLIDDELIYIGRVDSDGDVRLGDAVDGNEDDEDRIAEALCQQLEEAESDRWNFEPEFCPSNFRRLYQRRRVARDMTCQEYIEACQFAEDKGWDSEVSLTDLLDSPEVSTDEYLLYRAVDCLGLMGETIRVSDPENAGEPIPVTLV